MSWICLLFFTEIKNFNQSYSELFGGNGISNHEQEGEEGDAQHAEGSEDFHAKWGWVAHVDAVSEATHETWERVWQMNLVEFLNIICYLKDKADFKNREIDKWRRTH